MASLLRAAQRVQPTTTLTHLRAKTNTTATTAAAITAAAAVTRVLPLRAATRAFSASSFIAAPRTATMASTTFPVDTTLSAYADATTFPGIPRINGIAAITAGAASKGFPTRVRFVSKEELKSAAASGPSALAAEDAAIDNVYVTYNKIGDVDTRVVLASYGAKPTVNSLRKATVAAVNKLRGLKLKQAEFEAVPDVSGALPAIVQAAALTNYGFDRYLTTEAKVPTFIEAFHFVGADEKAVNEAAIMASGTIFARDLTNERADEMHPARMQSVAEEVAKLGGMKVHTIVGPQLVENGLHLMHAVGQAARHAPRYIELYYEGDPANPGDVMAVVGKGVCFDSGGLNLKTTGFMEDMHMDMGGAAAVLGAALTAPRLGLKRNIVFVVGAVENAIDSLSYKPHAIIRSHKGLTVENGNTDAEGRLVLADALSYCQSRHKPHTVMDLATLTGACVIALGEPLAGAFTNSKAMREAVVAAGNATYERAWPMPILEEHRGELTGTPFADLKSTGEGRYGGACTAAAFLENFIGHEPSKNARQTASASGAADAAAAAKKPAWVHLDIAGPASFSKDRGHMKRGGTGFGAQLVTEFLRAAPAGGFGPADELD